MRIRRDIVAMYRDVHSWAGVLSGLALFIAFYAGAITMFEEPLQRWATPGTTPVTASSLESTPELLSRVLAAYPAARREFQIHLRVDPTHPGRISWPTDDAADEHGFVPMAYASLSDGGELQVQTTGPSPVAAFVDVLHQRAGLPVSHETAMPVVGVISLLYVVAIVSGVVTLLPVLIRDLFAVRLGGHVRRMWLDLHNLLGVFSLPFHLVMALTAIVFAFHDQFYDAQGLTFAKRAEVQSTAHVAMSPRPVLPPASIIRRLETQAPGFTPLVLEYFARPGTGWSLRVGGTDPRYGLRGPTMTYAGVDPFDGTILSTDYLPGHQDAWGAAITSFFALHFGNFGGTPVRWAYVALGLAGAALFFTGNLLWVETRRTHDRHSSGSATQTRSTQVLAALTVGVPLGTIAGISTTIAAAKVFGTGATLELHAAVYYTVFVLFVAWACWRRAAHAGAELLVAAASATLLIPSVSAAGGIAPYVEAPGLVGVDLLAIVLAAFLIWAARHTYRRARHGRSDSVWSHRTQNAPALRRA